MLGRGVERRDLVPILVVVVFTFCVSGAIVTLTMVPASYLLPDFAQWWLQWAFPPLVFVTEEGAYPLIANMLGLMSLVVVAPVLEELLFRGYLLRRWAGKWGLWPGVVASSAVFGAVHPDALAAAVTGVGLALLYLKTQSLWAAIFGHAIYNLIVWLWELQGVLTQGIGYNGYAIEQLQADWWMGALFLLIALVLLDRVLKARTPLGPLRLPDIGRAPD